MTKHISPDYFVNNINLEEITHIVDNFQDYYIDEKALITTDLDGVYCILICLKLSLKSGIPIDALYDKLNTLKKRQLIFKLLRGHIKFIHEIINYPYLFIL